MDRDYIENRMRAAGVEPFIFDRRSRIAILLDAREIFLPRFDIFEGLVFLAPPLMYSETWQTAAREYIKNPTIKNKEYIDSYNWIDLCDFLWDHDIIEDYEDNNNINDKNSLFLHLIDEIVRGWTISLIQSFPDLKFNVRVLPPEVTGDWYGVGFEQIMS